VETKTVRITEKVATPPEEMEQTLREDPKLGYLFKKPEPKAKENEDDWTDSEDEYEETFGETLRRHLLSIKKFETAMKRESEGRRADVSRLEAELEATQMQLRESVKETEELRRALHFTALDKSAETQKASDLMKIVEKHAPEPVVKAAVLRSVGYQTM
jgi:hypothetical protein